MTSKLSLLPVLVLALLGTGAARATEIIYTPVNPNFGGAPLNAAGLLAAAQAQNDFKAPSINRNPPRTDLERFTENLQTAVLSRLTTTAVSSLFDADGRILAGKTISAGNFVITITDEGGNLVMNTTDKSTGASTRIVVGNAETAP